MLTSILILAVLVVALTVIALVVGGGQLPIVVGLLVPLALRLIPRPG